MKAILEFYPSDPEHPEDRIDLEHALNARKVYGALSDIDNWLRNKIKYGEFTPEELRILEEVRDYVLEQTREFLGED